MQSRLWVGGAALALIGAGSVTACGAGATVSQPSTAEASTSAPAAAAAHVGATLTLNGTGQGEKLQVTLVRMVDPAPPANQYEPVPAGMRELAMEIRYKNVGSTAYNQSILTDVTAQDAASHSYTPDLAFDTSAGPGFPNDVVNIAPGESADGFLSFQVPQATMLVKVKLGLDYGFGTADTGEWLVP
jgi:Domain of unknown function (DUF4352)